MIEELLTPDAVAVESFGDDPGALAELFPEEELLVEGAQQGRRGEFATVRRCAREALGKLGVDPAPILRDPKGAPRWPAGFVGAMTHCDGYRAAVVAPADRAAAIGIDAEPNLPLRSAGVAELVTVPAERAWLPALAARRPDVQWERLVFSAKESVYKVWYPLTGRWLDFEDAEITVDPAWSTFRARLLVPGPVVGGVRLDAFDGSWLVRDGLIVTAITLPALPAGGRWAGDDPAVGGA
ncbi:4'-phosphopantetheinyl transferase superfamily protein [Streptomyces sp. RerS4]|uniref:4'-phosphopantetheinyl transferase family protein n=1 Tax=Streptomyces sp. RerS4 TaxID=2942449 RepID=UPI00201BC175|nr:4'-phosphopantetheinyl transferase superfamily protein [Streptomyces sp. RerS4]UQX05342.1 4'-phosphopantetheinyl transferase superfamily protein [Streptomyces sp. RerS4]